MDAGLSKLSAADLARLLQDARKRTLELIADLDDEQMIGPRLAIVNPPLWEIGHVAWTQEFWALRHLRGQKPLVEGADALYNSTDVAPRYALGTAASVARANPVLYGRRAQRVAQSLASRGPRRGNLLPFPRLSRRHARRSARLHETDWATRRRNLAKRGGSRADQFPALL